MDLRRHIAELEAGNEAQKDAYIALMKGLVKVTESLYERYGMIPELETLVNMVDLTKSIALKHFLRVFEEGRELDPSVKSHPDVVAAYGIIQSMVEENK